jgi:glycosyltransferase involved in cell wall biosynthesis
MEGFGIAVIEATLAGLPAIVSRLEGLQDALIDGQNGVFVTPGDANGFIQAILTVLKDEDAYRRFKLSATKTTEEHFHWNAISKLYGELLEKEVAAKNTPSR